MISFIKKHFLLIIGVIAAYFLFIKKSTAANITQNTAAATRMTKEEILAEINRQLAAQSAPAFNRAMQELEYNRTEVEVWYNAGQTDTAIISHIVNKYLGY